MTKLKYQMNAETQPASEDGITAALRLRPCFDF